MRNVTTEIFNFRTHAVYGHTNETWYLPGVSPCTFTRPAGVATVRVLLDSSRSSAEYPLFPADPALRSPTGTRIPHSPQAGIATVNKYMEAVQRQN